MTRFLNAAGRSDVPVYEGPKTSGESHFTQGKWAEESPDRSYPDAIEFVLDTIRANPGQITLVAVAPLTNVGVLIRKDPETFRKLKRVVMMGGSVALGYGGKKEPEVEWNSPQRCRRGAGAASCGCAAVCNAVGFGGDSNWGRSGRRNCLQRRRG